VHHSASSGPAFGGNSLVINAKTFDQRHSGISVPDARGHDNVFKIPVDEHNNNLLTGDG
jgi:hypothetical protein